MAKLDLSFLSDLSNAFAPSGLEGDVRDLIIDRIKPHVDTLKIDGIGNLIATKGDGSRIVVMAHMDEVGFMITDIRDDGTLSFLPVGGIDPKHLAAKQVVIGKEKIQGVIGCTPVHLTKKEKKAFEYKNLYIQIGADSKKEAQSLVCIGDYALFDTAFSHSEQEDIVFGKALDNRAGCFLLAELIAMPEIADATFVFTVQEETGLRGAATFLQTHAFPYGIALDTTTANDLPGVLPKNQISHLGGGPVISYADQATIYNRDLIRSIFRLLNEKGISCQTKTKRTGGNEASAIEKVGVGSRAISVSVPCRYIHGPMGLMKTDDLIATKSAVVEILSFLKGDFHA